MGSSVMVPATRVLGTWSHVSAAYGIEIRARPLPRRTFASDGAHTSARPARCYLASGWQDWSLSLQPVRNSRHPGGIADRRSARPWRVEYPAFPFVRGRPGNERADVARPTWRLRLNVHRRHRNRRRAHARSEHDRVYRGAVGSCLALSARSWRGAYAWPFLDHRLLPGWGTHSDERFHFRANIDGCRKDDLTRSDGDFGCGGDRRRDGFVCPGIPCRFGNQHKGRSLWPCRHRERLASTKTRARREPPFARANGRHQRLRNRVLRRWIRRGKALAGSNDSPAAQAHGQ